mmetsp:Transcript_19958/g.40593  ORF Transcript_19958/g.40593 Transcript_19958/m.40593 type:complete len:408 (-) Transcript_19958:364-1587(-)
MMAAELDGGVQLHRAPLKEPLAEAAPDLDLGAARRSNASIITCCTEGRHASVISTAEHGSVIGRGRSTSASQEEQRAHGDLSRIHLRPQMALVRGRAVVNFNNQNTVLLKLQISDEDVALLHDNRLFCISLNGDHVKLRQPLAVEDPPPKPSNDELAQNIILRFQTSPKYRLLNALFLSFRLTDNLMLLTVAVLTVMHHGHITVPDKSQIAVYSAIGVELFYDVLLLTSKFWFLERLSPYIGIGLYVMYCSIVAAIGSPLYIWVVLGIRFAAFVIEESVDIAIDIEMHNDLLLLCDEWPDNEEELAYTDVRRSLLDFPYWPTSGFLVGSGSAWLPQSAFADETYSRRPFRPGCYRCLYAIPVAIFLPMALVIGAFVSIPLLFFLLVDLLTRRKLRNASLWAEMRHAY